MWILLVYCYPAEHVTGPAVQIQLGLHLIWRLAYCIPFRISSCIRSLIFTSHLSHNFYMKIDIFIIYFTDLLNVSCYSAIWWIIHTNMTLIEHLQWCICEYFSSIMHHNWVETHFDIVLSGSKVDVETTVSYRCLLSEVAKANLQAKAVIKEKGGPQLVK